MCACVVINIITCHVVKGVSRSDGRGRRGPRLGGARVDNFSLSSVGVGLDKILLVLVHLVVLILLEVLVVLRIVVVRNGVLLGGLGKVNDLAASATADHVVQGNDVVIVAALILLLLSYAVYSLETERVKSYRKCAHKVVLQETYHPRRPGKACMSVRRFLA